MDYLRRCIFTPYKKGSSFTLTMWDTGHTTTEHKTLIRYRLTQRTGHKRTVIFEGNDFSVPQYTAIDSDKAVKALMGFLTLRPGDTDREYFDNYTKAQMEFVEEHAEDLAMEVFMRFGE